MRARGRTTDRPAVVKPQAATQRLELAGVHAYYGSAHVLSDINLEVAAGSTLALMGRNGAGKTTLLRSIAQGLVRVSGEVRFAGRQLRGLRAEQVARLGVQLVPEDRRIFGSLSVADNLELGKYGCPRGETPPTTDEIIDLFPLLQPLLGRRGFALSGGEKQLLAVARAVMARPALLLLDEPSEGLAPRIVDEVGASIRRIQERFPMTVVLAEQNVAFALSLADEVFVIDNGQSRFRGTVTDFQQRPDIRDAYLKV